MMHGSTNIKCTRKCGFAP